VLLKSKEATNYSVQIFKPIAKESVINFYGRIPATYYERNEVDIYLSSINKLDTYPVKSKMPKKWFGYAIDKELVNEIIKNGTKIKSYREIK